MQISEYTSRPTRVTCPTYVRASQGTWRAAETQLRRAKARTRTTGPTMHIRPCLLIAAHCASASDWRGLPSHVSQAESNLWPRPPPRSGLCQRIPPCCGRLRRARFHRHRCDRRRVQRPVGPPHRWCGQTNDCGYDCGWSESGRSARGSTLKRSWALRGSSDCGPNEREQGSSELEPCRTCGPSERRGRASVLGPVRACAG